MFQRFKSNLDSILDPKIAEEQAKQNADKQRNGTPSKRSPSTVGLRKGTGDARNASPVRASAKKQPTTDPLGVSGVKGPDPEEFVIGEDGSDMSRAATPRPTKDTVEGTPERKPDESEEKSASKTQTQPSDVLPEDVRKKLAKLEILTTKYQDLLRNYRTAHARVAQIEPFESTLREHTPLTGIAEPGALVEFLQQRTKQSDMVMDELKRITGEHRQTVAERNDIKTKLDDAERRAKEAFDEAAGLQKERAEHTTDTSVLSVTHEDHIKLQDEVKKQVEYIDELATENAQLQSDLSTCRLDLDAARYNTDRRDREIETLQTDLNKSKTELKEALKVQQEHEENLKNGKYAQREEQRLRTYEEVVVQLRGQVKKTGDNERAAINKVNDLEFEIKRLESEANSSASIISRLRPMEERSNTLTKHLAAAESERDDAQRLLESKKGHEAAAASLRSQLKRAVEERDDAYQMILNCGKCSVPEHTKTTSDQIETRSTGTSDLTDQATPQSLEASTPNVEDDNLNGEGKKKKKKKSKSKTKKDQDSNNPKAPDNSDIANALETLKNQREERDDDNEEMRSHFESMIEEREQRLRDQLLIIKDREDEIQRLKIEIDSKDKIINKLEQSLKDQEGLQDEVDTLRESLTDLGGEVTNAKRLAADATESKTKLQAELNTAEADAAKALKELRESRTECSRLLDKCNQLEKDVASSEELSGNVEELKVAKLKLEELVKEHEALQLLHSKHEKEIKQLEQRQSSAADLESQRLKLLSADFERLKTNASTLETDLNAANMLAQSRYKELTDMKQTFSKVQPELKRLREESAELKSQKTDLEKATSTVRKLEARDRDLKAEINEHKTQATKRDADITDLKTKVKQARERSSALEDTYERSRKDIEEHQRIRDEAIDAREKLQQQLDKVQQERRSLRSQVDELEKQVRTATEESRGLREEVQVKTAKHDSAQSLMDSLENQSRELATQMKEVQSRCDGLEEELADSQRLLSERSREAETMRRLLADVEGRADTRVKEMRERLDLATEERDRAEDEASTLGRKRAREIEELKHRLRDLERDVARANDAKMDAERKESDTRIHQEDIERRFALAQNEAIEVRTAMTQLRDTLDEGERQAKELEKQKIDLRKTLEERENRLERLQKSSKAMAEELRTLQMTTRRQPSEQSSRSSLEGRVASPSPRNISTSNSSSNADPRAEYVYLKNILLQFLEQKDKRTQMQLVPVLGKLLHFDKSEESRWLSVVSAK